MTKNNNNMIEKPNNFFSAERGRRCLIALLSMFLFPGIKFTHFFIQESDFASSDGFLGAYLEQVGGFFPYAVTFILVFIIVRLIID